MAVESSILLLIRWRLCCGLLFEDEEQLLLLPDERGIVDFSPNAGKWSL